MRENKRERGKKLREDEGLSPGVAFQSSLRFTPRVFFVHKDQNIMDMDEPSFHLIAGRSIDSVRPLFSQDSKQLLVPSKSSVCVYSAKTGRIENILGDESLNDCVIDLQHHPKNSNQIIVFTTNGLLQVYDLDSKLSVSSIELFGSEEQKKVVSSARVFQYLDETSSREKTPKTFVFFTLDDRKRRLPALYMKEINLEGDSQPTPKKLKSDPLKDGMMNIFSREGAGGKLRVSFSSSGKFVSFCQDKQMCGSRLPPTKPGPNHLSEISFTCILSHPSEELVATGNDLGQIFLWSNFLDSNKPIKSILHWHPNPVTELCFSPTGSILYSGGSEAVIVCWEIYKDRKFCLPRLGASIKFLTTDRLHNFLSVTKSDNSVDIFTTDLNNFNKRIVPIVESIKSFEKLPSIAYQPQLDCLVARGRPGHLQMIPLGKNDSFKHFDVVGRNLFPEDDPNKMSNPQIWSFCVSSDGNWLVTDDGRDDGINLREERLKFWRFDSAKDTFVPNTIINLPHNKRINFLAFSPDSKTVLSTSDDGTFKLWNYKPGTKSWTSDRSGTGNNGWIPNKASFTSDSSLFALLFRKIVNFYGISKNTLELRDINLYDADLNVPVSGMCFGYKNYSHLFFQVRGRRIKIWNILDQKVIWTFDNSSSLLNLTIDPVSNQISCFSSDNNLLLLSFNKSDPEKSDLLKVPTGKLGSGDGWDIQPMILPKGGRRSKNNLILVTSNQEFFSLENLEENETFIDSVPMDENQTRFFGQVLDCESTFVPLIHPRKIVPQFNVDRLAEQLFLKNPSHTLPPMEQLCDTFMRCLLTGTNIKVEEESE